MTPEERAVIAAAEALAEAEHAGRRDPVGSDYDIYETWRLKEALLYAVDALRAARAPVESSSDP